jgi:hypothetical protein
MRIAARRAQVTRGSSRTALRQKVGAGDQVTRGGPGAIPSRGGTWRPPSCLEPGAGAGAMGTHGGLGAALCREAGAVVLT